MLSPSNTVTSNSTLHGSHEADSEACSRNGGGIPVAAPRGRECAKEEAAAVVTRRVTDTVEASLATGEAAKVVGVDGRVMARCTVGGSADHKGDQLGHTVMRLIPHDQSCTEFYSSIVYTR